MSDGLVVVLNVSLHPSEARVIERVCAAYDAALAEGRSGDAVGSGAATATHRLYLRSAVGLPPYGSVPLHPVLHQLLTPVTFAYEGPQLAEKLREAVVAEVWGCGGVGRVQSFAFSLYDLFTLNKCLLPSQAKRLDSAAASSASASSASGSKKVGAGKKRAPPLDISGLVTIGGNSALALAVRHGSTAVVEYLLQQVGTLTPASCSAIPHPPRKTLSYPSLLVSPTLPTTVSAVVIM